MSCVWALLSLVQICMISWRCIYSVLNDTNCNFSKMFLFMQILCDSNWVGYLFVAIIYQQPKNDPPPSPKKFGCSSFCEYKIFTSTTTSNLFHDLVKNVQLSTTTDYWLLTECMACAECAVTLHFIHRKSAAFGWVVNFKMIYQTKLHLYLLPVFASFHFAVTVLALKLHITFTGCWVHWDN